MTNPRGSRSDVPDHGDELPAWSSVLAVVAHPDDESFGLGAVLSAFIEQGATAAVLCFTRGEASTLGPRTEDLSAIRANELTAAAHVLGSTKYNWLTIPTADCNRSVWVG